MKHAIWVSFDLGVRGDYEGLYAWLDAQGAKECGNNVAFLLYEYSNSPKERLTEDLRQAVDLTSNSRIYVIYPDTETNKLRGSFIVGRRKAARWSGYAPSGEPVDVDEAF
ncbi:MAG: hypothetical protein JO047_10590 [Alphaproteobacteria bacterium]|nr:hypothetical protein [Alphaproteobacteria bacterium]